MTNKNPNLNDYHFLQPGLTFGDITSNPKAQEYDLEASSLNLYLGESRPLDLCDLMQKANKQINRLR
ncbi:MAG: hypothetical protein AABW50_05485 [Nanoarchaeota archaeon]